MPPSKPPSTPAGFRPDNPSRRVIDIPGMARPRQDANEPRRLVVPREVALAGEVTTCDHLVVEGSVDGKLADCQRLDVASTGAYKGEATVESAEIRGRLEGTLIVSGRLTVCEGGEVSGTVRYGELAVEPGGRLIGSIEPNQPSKVTAITGQGSQGEEPGRTAQGGHDHHGHDHHGHDGGHHHRG